MKVLFITGLYLPELVEQFVGNMSQNLLQVACNNYQWALVKGLAENNANANVISLPFLPCFPLSYKKMFTPQKSHRFSEGITIGSLRYCTLVGLKALSINTTIKKEIKRWIEEDPAEEHVVLVYHTIGYVMDAVAASKKKYPNLKACVIIGDVIDYDSNPKGGLFKSIQLRLNIRRIKQNYKFFDGFILMSKWMEEKIIESRGKSIVVEGIWNKTTFPIATMTAMDSHCFNILYSGTLEDFSGIIWLCQSFKYIKAPNIRLYICGHGACLARIKELARYDERIKYLGVMSQGELITLQREVNLLVNPRMANHVLTKYSFPSKTIEYMVSGTPMAGFRLSGIPNEYYQYMFTFEHTEQPLIAARIEEISHMKESDLKDIGQKAMLFIQEQKCPQAQAYKILNYLQDLL